MKNISLYEWAKNNDISYSVATKYLKNGKISEPITEDTPVPIRQTIKCEICNKAVSQITTSHLNLHNISLSEYKSKFPHALIVSNELSKHMSDTASKTVRTKEWCDNISNSKNYSKKYYTIKSSLKKNDQ